MRVPRRQPPKLGSLSTRITKSHWGVWAPSTLLMVWLELGPGSDQQRFQLPEKRQPSAVLRGWMGLPAPSVVLPAPSTTVPAAFTWVTPEAVEVVLMRKMLKEFITSAWRSFPNIPWMMVWST